MVERPDPVATHGELVVEVGAVAVNNADLLLRRGYFGPTPPIPGLDVAGTVVAKGRGADEIPLGARVVLNPAVSCGLCDHCRAGQHGICPKRSTLGQQRDGGYAEYVSIPQENALLLDDKIEFQSAAATPANYFTAWQMLMVRAALQPGETLLVTGAAGGVGSAVVQLAVLTGARVIAAVGTDLKREAVRSWGAHETVNYSTEDLADSVASITSGRGADVIVDVVGAALWPAYMTSIRSGGRLVTCSSTSGNKPELAILDLMLKQVTICGSGPTGAKLVAARVVALLNEGKLTPRVHGTFPLANAEDGHRLLEDRRVIGKIVLQPRLPIAG